MDDSDVTAFDEFLERVWGIKPKKESEVLQEIQTEQAKKRGRKPKMATE